MLRPLVNQPQITLFMATIGLTFVLEGLAQLFWGSQPHGLELGIQDEPMQWLLGATRTSTSASSTCSRRSSPAILVAVLARVLQTTRIGRALRAVADDHQAALAVGIPLQQIWAIVWAVAGFVALVAGLLWGARNGVQFALTFIALKALPVLILGGFESVAGAIVGGLIIGASEKLAEVYLGPFVGGGIEAWFPYVLALPSCWCGPKGCSAKSASTGSRDRCSIAKPASSRPPTRPTSRSSRSGRTASPSRSLLVVAFVVVPLVANQYWLSAILTPFLIFALAALGLEHPDRLRGPALARHGGVHGGGRVHGVQLRAAHARACRSSCRSSLAGLCAARGRHRVRPAEPAHQGLLPRRGDARLPVLRAVGAAARSAGSPTTAPPA